MTSLSTRQSLKAKLTWIGCVLIILVWGNTRAFAVADNRTSLQTSGDSVLIEKISFLILFETSSSQTDTFPEHQTEKLIALLDQFPEFSVRLEGRTDSIGSPKYNRVLAKRRMDFVRNELIKRGIESARFMEFVFGEEEPLASNENPEGRQVNRSVRLTAGLYTTLKTVSGQFISSQDDSEGIEGILYTGTRYNRDSLHIDSSGKFSFQVPADGIFSMEFFSKDHIMGRTFFNLSRVSPSLGKIPIKKLELGNTFNFEDILFVGNRAEVLPEYQGAKTRLLNMIRMASNYRFEIQGHINFRFSPQQEGTRSYELAQERAKTIYNYLIENGIDSTRLEWKGYSNWHMIFPEPETSSQASRNRRVSVKVLK